MNNVVTLHELSTDTIDRMIEEIRFSIPDSESIMDDLLVHGSSILFISFDETGLHCDRIRQDELLEVE